MSKREPSGSSRRWLKRSAFALALVVALVALFLLYHHIVSQRAIPDGPVVEDFPLPSAEEEAAWYDNWNASSWSQPFSALDWSARNIRKGEDGVLLFVVDDTGLPELQAGSAHPAPRKARYEVDVTLPPVHEGLCIAPLFLWNGETRDEVDFELTRKGLELTMHSYRRGGRRSATKIFPAAMIADRRVRLGIIADLEEGFIDFVVDGHRIHRFRRDEEPDAFPSAPMKPIMSMWTSRGGDHWTVDWLGRWEGGSAKMVVHDYRFRAQ